MDALLAGPWGLTVALVMGLSVGSFANVVIYRSPLEGLSSFRPRRSFCPSCQTRLGWRDNVPVLAWLMLRGRCRACAAPISWRYPAVELAVGALFVAAWWLSPPVDAAAAVRLGVLWYLGASCVIVTLIDLEHTIIPNTITYPGMVLGLVVSAAAPSLHAGQWGFRPEAPHVSSLVVALLGLAAGAGSLLLVGQLGNLMLRRQLAEAGVDDAMGLGDVKWMGLAGTFLGASQALSAILAACVAGAVVGIAMKLLARARGRTDVLGIPFGPWLSLGILLELASPGRPLALDLLERIAAPV